MVPRRRYDSIAHIMHAMLPHALDDVPPDLRAAVHLVYERMHAQTLALNPKLN